MKLTMGVLVGAVLCFAAVQAGATTRFVDINNLNPASPFTNWVAAATSIQDAVDIALAGDEIVVSNGVYEVGARSMVGSNRLVVTTALVVRSANGPAVTTIRGYQVPGTTNGPNAVRCVYLANGAVMSGFTLTEGATLPNTSDNNSSGGGVFCQSVSVVVSNCVVTGNSAGYCGGGACSGTLNDCVLSGNWSGSGGGSYSSKLNRCTLSGNSAYYGGGAYSGTLDRCTLHDNSASQFAGGVDFATLTNCLLSGNSSATSGGGAHSSTLNNCTLVGNSASTSGGGAYAGVLRNCLVYYNVGADGATTNNYSGGGLTNCCTTPLPATGSGNISAEPQLASLSHLSAGSPCHGTGSAAYASGLDIDGEPWANPPSIGCDEYWSGSLTGSLSAAILADYSNVAVGFSLGFQALISGRVGTSVWDFGDGTVVSNRPFASHTWAGSGDYEVVLTAYNQTHPAGVTAMATVHVVSQPVHYVAAGNTSPAAPYSTWATAASTIQDAVDAAAVPGALVLVSNGVYAVGATAVYGMSNRVAVAKPLVVQSVNGPAVTLIQGVSRTGAEAVRCVYLTNKAMLAGFTLTNGATQNAGDSYKQRSGGGVWCESAGGVVTNCVLAGNSANCYGGGAHSGTLNDCVLAGNSAAIYGGGAYNAMLNNCVLSGNSASVSGGGVHSGRLVGCALIGNSAASTGGGAYSSTLSGCTLSTNSALTGGGVHSGTLADCILVGNSVPQDGGGAYSSILNNCMLMGNSAGNGGGTHSCTNVNCTLTGNFALDAGGVYAGVLRNSIVYFNSGRVDVNYYGGSFTNCCTTPLPATGTGNFSAEPLLASLSHLSTGSPCRRAGRAAYTNGLDIDGEPWANPPSVGCDEYWSGSLTGTLSVAVVTAYTNVAVGFNQSFLASIDGRVGTSVWDFGDGSVLSNRPYATHTWAQTGDYEVILTAYNETYPAGVAARVTVHVVDQPVHYVAAGSAAPSAPYSNWATAAGTIQDAVDAATVPGSLVLVSNGVYALGATAVYGMSNRVAITKPLVVQSLNGPAATLIQGTGPTGPEAVRCAYLTNGAVLVGFTLTNGFTQQDGDKDKQLSGGGVWCESVSALVSDCVLAGNRGYYYGGGAYCGTLEDCTLTGNSACRIISGLGGGAYSATLNRCILTTNSATFYGGGASGSTLNNCTLTGNSAYEGGGARWSTLNNCALIGNSGSQYGGGATYATLNNCALISNSAYSGAGARNSTLNNCTLYGNSASSSYGAVASCTLFNCISYNNISPVWANWDLSSSLTNCCTTPLAGGVAAANFTNVPDFIDPAMGDFRLQASSPCINAGNNAYVVGTSDLGGNPRIAGGTADVGAYEFQAPASTISYLWLQQYGLSVDASSDSADPDHDGMTNWQEWIAGTNPTNATSALRMLSVTNVTLGKKVSWTAVTNRSYVLECSTNLTIAPAFRAVSGNTTGLAGTTTFTDTNAVGPGPFFYRVRIAR
jgi:hypothetical protein